MMLVVNGFIFTTRKNRFGTWFQINGPFIMTMIAVPLIMADLLRHLLQDQGVWEECHRTADEPPWPKHCKWSSTQYKCEIRGPDHCIDTKKENMAHLSFIGVLFTICFTYLGFVFLFIGVLWNANIIKKCKEIKAQWRELRGQMQEA